MCQMLMQNEDIEDNGHAGDGSRSARRVVVKRRDLVRGLAAGTIVAYLPSCEVAPDGSTIFTGGGLLISDAQLAQMSRASWTQLRAEERVSTSASMNRQLTRVGDRITAAAGQASYPWEYAVFDSEAKNAFVLPSRQVGFYSGIMAMADNDDQIACVMGHEVAHVTYKHSKQRYAQAMTASLGAGLTNVVLEANDVEGRQAISAALGLGIQFGVLLPYSRRHELEADEAGLIYMARAGYNPYEAVRFWERMEADSGQRPPEFLSTHPDPERRIQRLDQLARNMGYGPV